MYLPENLAPEDLIKNTISALPITVESATIAKLAEVEGEKVDNVIKLELLKKEEDEIKLEKIATEKVQQEEEKLVSPVPSLKPEVLAKPAVETDFAAQQLGKEQLIDKATVMTDKQTVITLNEIKEINDIIENLPTTEKSQVEAEIAELKKDVTEYKEDVEEVEKKTTKLTETKSAKILSKRVQKLLADMDQLMDKMDKAEKSENVKDVPKDTQVEAKKNTVNINEMLATIQRIRGVSNDETEKKLVQVLKTLDKDHDGKIDDLNDVLRVFEMIEQENVKVTKDQLGKFLTLLEKEKLIEREEEQQKVAETAAAAAAAKKN